MSKKIRRVDNRFVYSLDAFDFLNRLSDNSIHLFLFDPPFYKIVKEEWDNQWASVDDFVNWFVRLICIMEKKIVNDGSIIFFGAIGKHHEHAFWKICLEIEERTDLYYRNSMVWSKKRAYGKTHDYLFTRQEMVWYSKSSNRTQVRFNIPYSKDPRTFKRKGVKYKPKSEMKRLTNVWNDISEMFYPERVAQKPLELMSRLVVTHSLTNDIIVDPFAGWGTTGLAAITNKRRFIGTEIILDDARWANQRIVSLATEHQIKPLGL